MVILNYFSLFDGGEERYQKCKQNAQEFIISQIGLACFKEEKNNNWSVKIFKFYIYPVAFASLDKKFTCQTSSLEFLTSYKFDFNKVS